MRRRNLKFFRFDQIKDPVAVSGKAEKPVFFPNEFKRHAMLGAFPVIEFRWFVKLLAAHAIEAFVSLAVKIAFGGAGIPEGVDASDESWIARRANELVVGDVKLSSEPFEAVAVGGNKIRNSLTHSFRSANVFEAVVVGPTLKPDILAKEPEMASIGIGLYELEREPDMR
jgi:hypothetical protein